MAQAQRDLNHVTTLIGVDSNDTTTTANAHVNSSNGRLLVEATGTVTGQQYTDGDVDANPTGSLSMFKNPSDEIVAASADASGNLNVNIAAGSSSGTEYTEGDIDATITGPAVLAEGPSNTLTPLQADSNSNLKVTIEADNAGIGGGTQYAEDTSHTTGDTGTLSLAVRNDTPSSLVSADGDYTALTTDSTGKLHVNVGNTVAVSGSVTTSGTVTANAGTNLNTSALALESGGNLAAVAGAVSGSEMQVDIVAALPSGTNNIGDVDIASAIPAGTNNIGDVDIASAIPAGTNTIGAVESDGTALGNGQVSVNTTAGGTTILAASAGRQGAVITNQGSVTCYIGTGSVTTSNGFLLAAGESIALPTDSDIKGITASSSTTVGYLSFS